MLISQREPHARTPPHIRSLLFASELYRRPAPLSDVKLSAISPVQSTLIWKSSDVGARQISRESLTFGHDLW